MKTARPKNGANTIPMVNKALELVRTLSSADGETTTKALAISLGLPRSTCYRILRSLVAQNWVCMMPEGRHELSLGLLPLLKPLHPLETLAERLAPVLARLAQQMHLTAKASVRQGDYAVTIARCESPRETSVSVRVGASFPLALGSSGAVLSSDLSKEEVAEIVKRAPAECWTYQPIEAVARRLNELKSQGWCADLGTFRPSCHALSVPIRGAGAQVIAALTVIGFPHELNEARLEKMAREVLDAARQAERAVRDPAERVAAPAKRPARASKHTPERRTARRRTKKSNASGSRS